MVMFGSWNFLQGYKYIYDLKKMCINLFFTETAKILARVPDPSKETMDKARFIFYQNNVNRYKFITTPQQNCTHTK